MRESNTYTLGNGNTAVETWSGEFELPNDGSITPDVVDAFTTGHCHSFALAMNKVTGWKMYASVGPWDEHNSPSHVFLKHPSGRFVDIEGFISEKARWLRHEVIPVTQDDIENFEYYFKPQPELAKPFVNAVLAKVGGAVVPAPSTKRKAVTR